MTALMHSCIYYTCEDTTMDNIVKLLLQREDSTFGAACSAGINVNLQSNFGSTALIWATNFETRLPSCNIVELLLHHKDINVNLQNHKGWTVLMNICLDNIDIITPKHEHQLELLLQREDINVNIQNNKGETALILSCKKYTKSTKRVVELLLEHKDINVNVQDRQGETALARACNHGKKTYNITERVVELLLQREDINVGISNNDDFTAFDHVCDNVDDWNTPPYILELLLYHPSFQSCSIVYRFDRGNSYDMDKLMQYIHNSMLKSKQIWRQPAFRLV